MLRCSREFAVDFLKESVAARAHSKDRRSLAVAGLFAGVGGFERGLHRAGHETILLCEIDPTARAVLRERFPGVQIDRDVRRMRSVPRETELLVGGFPCQDLSQAGLTRGLRGANSALVSQIFRLLNHRRVPYVVL